VPFQWTFGLLPIWAMAVGLVLLVFNVYDQYIFVREDVETPGALAEDVQPAADFTFEVSVIFSIFSV
jgi:hypothetical protein